MMADSRGIYSAMEPLDHMLEFEALRRMVIHRKARHPASGIRHPRGIYAGQTACAGSRPPLMH